MKNKSILKTAGMGILFAALFLTMAGCGPDPFYIQVAHIEGVPETGEAGTPLTLTGTVRPSFASNKNIVWSVKNTGTTGASISGNILNANAGGTVTIRALIANGIAEGKEYIQDFKIIFTMPKIITNIAVKTQPAQLTYTSGETLDLSGLAVTLTFDTGPPEDISLADFTAKGITTSPAQGTALTLAHNGQPVKVSAGGYTALTNNLTVNKSNPADINFPTAAAITYGDALSASALSGGDTGRGSFAWQSPAAVPAVINSGYPVEFTPNDTDIHDYTGVDGWDGAKVVRTVSVTVNKKSIVIIPTSELSKVYNAPPNPDPTFTYTSSPALISGDAFSGALGREAGENAGTYAIEIGTLTAGDNYTLSLAGRVVFTINKAAGAAVTVPTVEGDNTAFTIKVTAPSVLSTATGQSIEYAISTSDSESPGSLTWAVDKYTFAGADVAIDTAYYVYARSKENENYNAGTPSVSADVGIYPTGSTVTISFAQISDAAPNITGPALILSRSADDGHPKHITLTIEGSGYDSISWEITGTGFTGQGITGTGDLFKLDATDARYNQDGDHYLTLIVFKDGVPYNKTVIFTIVP
jgi:hypothetical protein